MHSATLLLLVVGTAVHLFPANRDNSDREQGTGDSTYVVLFSVGPNWNHAKPANEQDYFQGHSVNLRSLRETGRLVIGARYADKGMIILRARDRAEAEYLFARDTMVVEKVFSLELHSLYPFYKGCLE